MTYLAFSFLILQEENDYILQVLHFHLIQVNLIDLLHFLVEEGFNVLNLAVLPLTEQSGENTEGSGQIFMVLAAFRTV
jgi:hypothetical protein